MFILLFITACLNTVPYGNVSDPVPNKFIENTHISTGLFYSIHLPEHGNLLVSYKNRSVSHARRPVLVGDSGRYRSDRVSDANLFVFHPSHGSQNSVKIFHKELLATVVLPHTYDDERYIIMENSYFSYLFIEDNYRSRLSSLKIETFLRHCRDSTFRLKEKNVLFYELFNFDESEMVVYNPDTKELNSRASSDNHATLLKLVPERYRLGAVITEFDYNNFTYSTLEALAVDVPSVQIWNFTNESYDQTESHAVEIKGNVINTAECSFPNSEIKSKLEESGMEIEVEANFDFATPKAVHMSESWSTKSTSLSSKRKTVIEETSFHLTSTVSVAPRKTTEYMLVWKRFDVEVSFTAKVKIHAFADRINKDGSVSEMVRVDPEGVLALMAHSGFSRNVTRNENEIFYITGSVRVKGATKGQTKRRDFNLDNDPVPCNDSTI